eukprot:4606273-Pleurochrysis_carterae.AAC.1
MIFCPRSLWRGTHYDGQRHQGVLALSAPFIVDRRDFKDMFEWLNARGLCVKKGFDNKFPELVAPIRRILDVLLREAVVETPESDDDVKNCKRPRDDESFNALESDDESPLDLLNAQQESSSESSSYDPEPSPTGPRRTCSFGSDSPATFSFQRA